MPLRHDLFWDPQFGGMGIAQSWIERAREMRHLAERPEREFERFAALWMAFNAWGMCVTLAETDAAMIRDLGRDRDVQEIFDHTVATTDIRTSFARIERSFPLPSFSDLLRLDPQYNWRGDRNEEYWEKIASAPRGKKVRLSPRLDHRNLIWSDVLGCAYKVRCNLLHGGKMANPREARFVAVFADLLESMLTDRRRNLLMLGRR